MFRRRFALKLVLLIALAYIIPVATALLTLHFSSKATIKSFSHAIDGGNGSQDKLLEEIFPHGRPNIQNKEVFSILARYEKRRSFGLFTSLLVISMVLAAVVVIISIIILKRAMFSLRELSSAARKVGNGHFDVELKARSLDEFAKLAKAFTLMTKKLKETTVSRDYYNHMLEVMPAAVFTANRNGNVASWNQQAELITGFKGSDIVGKPTKKIDILSTLIKSGEGRNDVQITTKSGKQRYITCDIEHFADKRGNDVIGIFIDTTEEKEMEQQLVVARDRAEEASRLRTEFLANMSHEIRTPLNGIIGMADILIEEEQNDEKKGMLSTIHQCGKRLLHIINEILELSKLEAGKERIAKEKVELMYIVGSAMAAIDATCRKKNLECTMKIENDLPEYIHTDTDKLTRILTNLLSNSVKFTDKGSVKLEISKYNGPKKGDTLFSVKDTGRGIPEDRLGIIFESFVQLEEYLIREDGTGLGLAISKKLVELLGGEIWVESEKRKGTNFFFTVKAEA